MPAPHSWLSPPQPFVRMSVSAPVAAAVRTPCTTARTPALVQVRARAEHEGVPHGAVGALDRMDRVTER